MDKTKLLSEKEAKINQQEAKIKIQECVDWLHNQYYKDPGEANYHKILSVRFMNHVGPYFHATDPESSVFLQRMFDLAIHFLEVKEGEWIENKSIPIPKHWKR